MEPNKDLSSNEPKSEQTPNLDTTSQQIKVNDSSTSPATPTSPELDTPDTVVATPKPYTITPISQLNAPVAEPADEEPVFPMSPSVSASGPTPVVVSSPETTGAANSGSESKVFGFGGVVPPKAQKRWTKKKWFLLGGGVVAVLALLAGSVYAFYIPNTPSAVWNTAIARTGKGLDSVVQSATEQSKLDALKTSKIDGTLTAKMGGETYSGDFNTSFDATTLDSGLNVTLKSDGTNQKISAKVQAETPKNSMYPNIYFQVSGYKTLGLDSFMPGINDYDGKWIVIKSETLKQLSASYVAAESDKNNTVTSADIAELARTASSVTTEYVFNTDPTKAVLERRSFVGKETVDGVSTYHYKVGVNTEHAVAYCKALTSQLLSTQAYKKLAGADSNDLADQKKAAAEECSSSVKDSIKASDEYDLWVDSKYKLVYKVRAYSKEDKKSYTELGQLYKGGDELSLFMNIHDEIAKMDSKVTVATNTKTNATKATMSVAGSDRENPYSLNATLNAAVSSDAVKITPPTNPVLIEDVLKRFGYDTSGLATSPAQTSTNGTTSVQLRAQDTERKTDIAALQSHLEAYYAENGFYPTLTQLNTTSWFTTNMKGLDAQALQDPTATTKLLSATPVANQYSYVAAECKGNECQSFTLTAVLSDGTKYTKTSL